MNAPRARGSAAVLAAALTLALLAPSAASPRTHPSGTPAIAPRLPATSSVVVDPALPAHLGNAPAPAILAWDPAETSHARVRAHLWGEGIDHVMLDALHMAIACTATPADIPGLTGAPGAISVWGDEALHPALSDSVPTAFNGNPENVWTGLGVTGEGVAIAVIDTGINASHPDLTWHERTRLNVKVLESHREALGPGNEVPGCQDVVGEDEQDTEVASGHGTHIASVAAGDGTASGGRYTGMAPGATLVGYAAAGSADRPYDVEISGTRPSLVRAVAAIDHLLARELERDPVTKVALLGFTTEGLFDPFSPLSLALQYLYEYDVVPVLPAGNEGPEPSSCDAAETCRINKYSASPWTIAVGATPDRSRTTIESYSSRGDPQARDIWGRPYRYHPTIVAPGTGVVAARRVGVTPFLVFPGENRPGATGPQRMHRFDAHYQPLTGTSVAAAHVAGAVALMQEAALDARGCFLTAKQVGQILTETATPVGSYAEHEAGAGALDATAAVWGAISAPNVTSGWPHQCP